MSEYVPLELPEHPKLAENIVHFARALRRAGLPIGTGRVVDAVSAVRAAGFSQKQHFYWTLHACFVNRPEHRVIFSQVFRLYWRDPRYVERMMSMMLPAIRGFQEERKANAAEKRAAYALLGGQTPESPKNIEHRAGEETRIEVDASFTISEVERLTTTDFEKMSTAEIVAAKAMLARLTLPVSPLKSRRSTASMQGKVYDSRANLRRSMRHGGEIRNVQFKEKKERWPNLILLCDISGSMSQYSRMVLHFLHAVSNHKGAGWAEGHAFTFGTRLTNITRHLRTKDVDVALASAGAGTHDWEGGTCIGACLRRFNQDWSHRVMGQGSIILLITDGLYRDRENDLSLEMQRLHRSAKRLIWLNPLLRWDKFAAKASGIRTMLPHVDSFRASHSIASLEDLAKVFSSRKDTGEKQILLHRMNAL